MVGVGALIWLSVRPLLRLAIMTGSGFVVTRLDMFPPVAARAAGQIMLTILYPALMFSKIVPAFGQENLPALGPLVLVAIIYQAMGILSAYVIRHLFWTPHRFRYGILVAGGWGNVGDIPAAVITAVTASAPFTGPQDANLSIAYISAFIVYNMITLFPCGGHHWVSRDFQGPDVENDEMRRAAKIRRKKLLVGMGRVFRRRSAAKHGDDGGDLERNWQKDKREALNGHTTAVGVQQRKPAPQITVPAERGSDDFNSPTTLRAEESIAEELHASCAYSSTTSSQEAEKSSPSKHTTNQDQDTAASSPERCSTKSLIFSRIKAFIKGLLLPLSVVVLLSFLISLIPALKYLFVPTADGSNRYPPAPDGQPPLAFIMDAATFAGAGAVPLGLICLGSALARLKMPGEWKELPVASIGWLAVVKMVVTPVLGVLIVQGLTGVGVIDREDKVLRFVCIFYSCLPTFTTQVMLTQVYSGTGEAEYLPAYLIPQYALMFLSLTAVTAYTLHILF
ncbi:auxin efflux carrier [Pterulicium gracile]|uniref:Auxin efflux carrier n=1 Tax=Pterulicium gracile TaxID=1884261 RepID=A0A5C3QF63_9AGAR|nr:auxin efflux carrier [Pterula gracilis]